MRYENAIVCPRCGVITTDIRKHKNRKRCEAVEYRRAKR